MNANLVYENGKAYINAYWENDDHAIGCFKAEYNVIIDEYQELYNFVKSMHKKAKNIGPIQINFVKYSIRTHSELNWALYGITPHKLFKNLQGDYIYNGYDEEKNKLIPDWKGMREQIYQLFPEHDYNFIVSNLTDLKSNWKKIDDRYVNIYHFTSQKHNNVPKSKYIKYFNNVVGPMTYLDYDIYRNGCLPRNDDTMLSLEVYEHKVAHVNTSKFSACFKEPELGKANTLDDVRIKEFIPFDDHFDLETPMRSKIEYSGTSQKRWIKLTHTNFDKEVQQLNCKATTALTEWLRLMNLYDPDTFESIKDMFMPLDSKICPVCGELYNAVQEKNCPGCEVKNPDYIGTRTSCADPEKDPEWMSEEWYNEDSPETLQNLYEAGEYAEDYIEEDEDEDEYEDDIPEDDISGESED